MVLETAVDVLSVWETPDSEQPLNVASDRAMQAASPRFRIVSIIFSLWRRGALSTVATKQTIMQRSARSRMTKYMSASWLSLQERLLSTQSGHRLNTEATWGNILL